MEMKMLGFWVFSGLIVLSGVSDASKGISCREAMVTLSPCNSYLTDFDLEPGPGCCEALEKLNQAANTPAIRKQMCLCFKEEAPKCRFVPAMAKELPIYCRSTLPVPLYPHADDRDKIHA